MLPVRREASGPRARGAGGGGGEEGGSAALVLLLGRIGSVCLPTRHKLVVIGLHALWERRLKYTFPASAQAYSPAPCRLVQARAGARS